MNKVFIGTSGWSYDHWQGIFYPVNLPKSRWLEYYTEYFETVEINSTFYHLPREKTVKNWLERTPEKFIFAVKAGRFITHLKQLKDPAESLERFWQIVEWFGEKLGPILFQFPPKFEKDKERFHNFLSALAAAKEKPVGFKKFSTRRVRELAAVMEFRHPSWFCDEVYEILRKFNVALCFSDTPRYPYCEEVTADFVYLRLHGHERLYASRYTKEQLDEYVTKIKNWMKEVSPPKGRVKDIYCYFDNDAEGYAVQNAIELRKKISVN